MEERSVSGAEVEHWNATQTRNEHGQGNKANKKRNAETKEYHNKEAWKDLWKGGEGSETHNVNFKDIQSEQSGQSGGGGEPTTMPMNRTKITFNI